jgi:tetratricopeptide (TPR) repeat protein
VAPEIAADLTSADYARNRDPALETILALSPEEVGRPLVGRLQAAYQAGGLEAAVEAYLAYKADPSHRYVSTEGAMNGAGYFLLGEGLVEEAIRIFQLNVEAYPDSWNVHDSLGEAYMEAGQTGLAIHSYEKALEINPDNDNAISMLEKLRSEEEG